MHGLPNLNSHMLCFHIQYYCIKVTLEQVTKAQSGGVEI